MDWSSDRSPSELTSRPAFHRTILSRTRFLRIVAAGIGLCAITLGDPSGPPSDPRPAKLAHFFESYNCPRPWPIDAYLRAADQYQIDYRFLPVVSVMESTCGRHQQHRNWWGWNSAETAFSSVAQGIDYIGSRLAESPYYRGLTVEEKLYAYNPYEDYVEKAKSLMASIEGAD